MRPSWRLSAVLPVLASSVSAAPHWGHSIASWSEDAASNVLQLAQLRARIVTSGKADEDQAPGPSAIQSITEAQTSGLEPAAAFGPDGYPRLPPEDVFGSEGFPRQAESASPGVSFGEELELGSMCMCEDGRSGTVQLVSNETNSTAAAPAPAPALAPFPPPAPPAESSLNVTTTPLPLTAVTFLPPSARGWTANDTYEAQYGHKNITFPSPIVNGTRVTYPEYPPDVTTTLLPAIADAIDKMVHPLNITENASAPVRPLATAVANASAAAASATATVTAAPSDPSSATAAAAAGPTTTISALEHDLALDCVLGQWSVWSPCGQHEGDGMRQSTEERYRPIINPHHLGGMPCLPRVQRRPCGADWVDGVYTGTEYSVDARSGRAAMGIADWVDGGWSPGSIISNPGSIIPKFPGGHGGNRSNITVENGTITGPGGRTCTCEI